MTDLSTRLSRSDLEQLCHEKAEESLQLEFKLCDELRPGSIYRENSEEKRRTIESIKDELSKDISSFLNSAGGTIIYGIRENKSRAKNVDIDGAFKSHDDQRLETILQTIRQIVQPPPTVNAYRVFENSDDPQSPWYVVIDIPQGQLAYMARDKRFYKRVGSIRQAMEQYEVMDVMNRTRGAALTAEVDFQRGANPSFKGDDWTTYRLKIALTSENYIASEYGAAKLTLARPLQFGDHVALTFRESVTETGVFLDGRDEDPHAQSLRVTWGASSGVVIFPGDWFDFHNNAFQIEVPSLAVVPDPTYLVKLELFTLNSQSRIFLYTIRANQDATLQLFKIEASNYESIMPHFWTTYHAARERMTAH